MRGVITVTKEVTQAADVEVDFPFFRKAQWSEYPSPDEVYYYAVMSPDVCWQLIVTYSQFEGDSITKFRVEKGDNRHSINFVNHAQSGIYFNLTFKQFQEVYAECLKFQQTFGLATGLVVTPPQT